MAEEIQQVKRKILIADDTFDGRQLLSRLLAQFTNADVAESRDGLAAWTDYQVRRPEITFLDIEMPEINGIDVLRQIREADPKAFVVMVSGFSAIEKVQEAIALGIGGFVVKPYSPQRILDLLRKYAAETGDSALLRAG
jgi:two-component system, chemotaxis family, chemotaxis protein CheY